MTAFAERMATMRAAHPEPLVSHVDDPVAPGVGWSVHEVAPPGTWYQPRGGVVVHVDVAPDPETGEVGDRYLVVRVSQGHLHWTSLRADQVSAHPGRPNAHTIRGVCQVAGRELARPNRRTWDDAADLELWSLGARLTAVLARPGVTPP